MIGLKNSYEIAYNGTENECRFELYADSAADLQGLTNFDGIKIQMGSECAVIATGDKYILNGSGAWILQPSDCAFSNVYTKAEIDSMITEIYGIIAYYHTILISDTGEITFYAIAGYIGTWTIYGNGSQTGTPTPDNPVTPEFVGVRTGNLVKYWQNAYVRATDGAVVSQQRNGMGYPVSVSAGQTITFSANTDNFSIGIAVFRDFDGTTPSDMIFRELTAYTYTATENCYVVVWCNYDNTTIMSESNFDLCKAMVNLGSTALPYEPYGYKIPITCGGQTNNIYLSAPLRKAIDGTDAVDTIDSSGTLTRNVDENGDALVTPTTETVSVPNIPTFRGENTLTVDTILKPSLIEISGGITHE